ncbi:baseplate J/gp47 family protein, partial [Paenibacillus forsythiae]
LELNTNLFFADTATGEFLERSIAWSGIARRPASPAEIQGAFYADGGEGVDIPIGSRFSLEQLNYTAAEKLSPGNYRLTCETPGTVGNRNSGALLPIDYIPQLSRGEAVRLLIPGENAEDDETLRKRYFDSARRPATSGNKAHYAEWALQIPGVGGARVFPLWNGLKTVKVVIVDAEQLPASSALVAEVQNYIDPVPGQGEGQAPIGAEVTVASAAGKTINVAATVSLASGYALHAVTDAFAARLEQWRKGAAFAANYVSQAVIGSLLLGTDGVLDYFDLMLNGGSGNVSLADDEAPLIGTVDLEV